MQEENPKPIEVECPFCGAKPGEKCIARENNPYGERRRTYLRSKPHKQRIQYAEAARLIATWNP